MCRSLVQQSYFTVIGLRYNTVKCTCLVIGDLQCGLLLWREIDVEQLINRAEDKKVECPCGRRSEATDLKDYAQGMACSFQRSQESELQAG